jgi:hypothetical protein
VGLHVAIAVHAEDPAGNAADSAPVEFDVCGAEPFATAVPNSTGQAARMSGLHDPSLGANDFVVIVDHLPPFAPAALFVGDAKLATGVPLGAGLRYVDGTTRRVAWAEADPAGRAAFGVNFTHPAFAGIVAGDTRYFQVQYQDFGTPLFLNASDALEVVFCD